VVRFGLEGFISEPLRPYHSAAILDAYRDLFRSEICSRVASLAGNLGLPKEFVEKWCNIEFDLKRMVFDIELLRRRLEGSKEEADRTELEQRIARRVERFHQFAENKYECRDQRDPREVVQGLVANLAAEYNIVSADSLKRLEQVAAISREWV